MSKLIDTNIAIYLTNGSIEIEERIAAFDDRPLISLLTLVELEGGVIADSLESELRRLRLDALLANVEIVGFDNLVVAAYAKIVATLGFSRSRVLDRLIAATALVNNLTLVTANGADFRDIPDLKLEVWPTAGQ